jgi:hypothetical protein
VLTGISRIICGRMNPVKSTVGEKPGTLLAPAEMAKEGYACAIW